MMIFNMTGGRGGGSATGLPHFTYTGNYDFVDDGDGNWRLKLLTSGILTFFSRKGIADGVQVFLVGGGGGGSSYTGGGGGGGGGYTKTVITYIDKIKSGYGITVGSGGAINKAGEDTEAFNAVAEGGRPGANSNGGNGGSGGGAGRSNGTGGNGGSNGGDGAQGNSSAPVGKGQGTTTREFGDSNGALYSGGGGGGGYRDDSCGSGGSGGGAAAKYSVAASAATANSGGGGAGQSNSTVNTASAGGSGIVVIRNIRQL